MNTDKTTPTLAERIRAEAANRSTWLEARLQNFAGEVEALERELAEQGRAAVTTPTPHSHNSYCELHYCQFEFREMSSAIAELERANIEQRAALVDMLRVYEMLMPGIRHIAVQDYQLLNEAPIRARKAI